MLSAMDVNKKLALYTVAKIYLNERIAISQRLCDIFISKFPELCGRDHATIVKFY